NLWRRISGKTDPSRRRARIRSLQLAFRTESLAVRNDDDRRRRSVVLDPNVLRGASGNFGVGRAEVDAGLFGRRRNCVWRHRAGLGFFGLSLEPWAKLRRTRGSFSKDQSDLFDLGDQPRFFGVSGWAEQVDRRRRPYGNRRFLSRRKAS